jgi:hypothetical protein
MRRETLNGGLVQRKQNYPLESKQNLGLLLDKRGKIGESLRPVLTGAIKRDS